MYLYRDILQYIQEVKDGQPVQSATKTTVQPAAKTDKKKPSQQLAKSVSQGSKQTFTDVPVDSSRVAAAQRVAQHKASTPHTYTSSSCALDRVFELGYSDHHHLTAFLVKAAALTVQVRVTLSLVILMMVYSFRFVIRIVYVLIL